MSSATALRPALQQPVYVLRPYPRRIREQVFAVLHQAGRAVASTDTVPRGTSDDDVLNWLSLRSLPRALLVPFHAHRKADGSVVDGFSLIGRLRAELPRYRGVPIISPISALGRAAAELRFSREPAWADSGVLFIVEEELSDDTLPAKLRRHVSGS